jgi:hypothetical protein
MSFIKQDEPCTLEENPDVNDTSKPNKEAKEEAEPETIHCRSASESCDCTTCHLIFSKRIKEEASLEIEETVLLSHNTYPGQPAEPYAAS